jgi:hypothetical protein
MTSEGDLWRMVVGHEREFGGVVARQNATDANVERVAERVEAGFAENKQMIADAMRAMTESVMREGAHMRGEISRLDEAYRQQRKVDEDERKHHEEDERRRTADLIASLRETAERSEAAASKVKQLNRRIIFAVVVIGALASAFIENAPALFNLIGHTFDANIAG